MSYKNFILTLITLVLSSVCVCQDSPRSNFNYEIGITPFRLERNSETVNFGREFKTLSGAYFIYSLNKGFGIISKVEYGENVFHDDCNCADGLNGQATLREFNAAIGVRLTFLEQKESLIRPYLQMNFNYSRIHFQSVHTGGFVPTVKVRKDLRYYVGPEFKFGFELYPWPRIPITISHGYKGGWGEYLSNINDEKDKIIGLGFTTIEFRIGVLL